MTRKFSRDFINQVLDARPIEYWASKYLKLRKKGKDAFCVCPFHHENTPSFSINLEKGFFYCFGCQKSGNAIDIHMHFEKSTFVESLESMATECGIRFDKIEQPHQEQLAIIQSCAKFYQKKLKDTPDAISYLKGRGLSGLVAKEFMLGFSPQSLQELNRLIKTPYSKLFEAGMALKSKKDNSYYPRFRNRIMFPIQNATGQVIAFGGRITGDGEPKYLNSSESGWFDKSQVLYGLYQARQKRAESAIVVEGYLDVISLYQHEIYGAVAPMGTSITSRHLLLLCRYFKDIVLCFDGDKPGQLAMRKSFEKLLPIINDQVSVRFMVMPNKHDPDSFIKQFGKEAWREAQESAMSIFDYTGACFFSHGDDLSSRVKSAVEVKPLIEQMPNSITKHALIKYVGEKLELGEKWMNEDLSPAPPPEPTVSSVPAKSTVCDKLWNMLLAQAGPIMNELSVYWNELKPLVPPEKNALLEQLARGDSLAKIMEENRNEGGAIDFSSMAISQRTEQGSHSEIDFVKSLLIKLTIHYLEHNINTLIYRLKREDADEFLRKQLNEYIQKKNSLKKLARIEIE